MFAKAREADMDLKGLGEQLAMRKAQLMGTGDMDEDTDARRRGSSSRDSQGSMARLARRMRGE
jgi:hypothetical protein